MLQLTAEQVLALAPDASSASAGKKLSAVGPWSSLGRSERAFWGLCQGSAVYQTRVDRSDLTAKCSCPSRKFPCKHALGLMLLAAQSAASFVEAAEPEWVSDWLDKRGAARAAKEAKATAEPKPVDAAAKAKREEQRRGRVEDGVALLDRFLEDLVRTGLGAIEHASTDVFDAQARRLVDAQAPGLAARVRRLGEIVSAGAGWQARFLAEAGKLALLTEAFARIETLDDELATDVRTLVGWTSTRDEVLARGARTTDELAVIAQWTDDDDRVRVQRTWLRSASGALALIVQSSAGGQPFPESLLPGTWFRGTLAFYPGASRIRALVAAREGATTSLGAGFPGAIAPGALLDEVAARLAKQPWLDRFGAHLARVRPARLGDGFVVVGDDGVALPLDPAVRPHRLLAISGGAAIDLTGEWDGARLRPFGAIVGDRFFALEEAS